MRQAKNKEKFNNLKRLVKTGRNRRKYYETKNINENRRVVASNV